jgi:maltodextrin utilization protein YvdJ
MKMDNILVLDQGKLVCSTTMLTILDYQWAKTKEDKQMNSEHMYHDNILQEWYDDNTTNESLGRVVKIPHAQKHVLKQVARKTN